MLTILSIVLSLSVTTVLSTCPLRGAPIGSSVRAFYLTSGVYDDTQELQKESEGLLGSAWTEEVQRLCNAHISCDSNQTYRSFDGTCNNLKRPAVGSRGQCYRRILPASYVDGLSEPPKRVSIARIFNALQSRSKLPPPPFSTMFAAILQFVVHDIMETAMSQLEENFDCCDSKNRDLTKCAMSIDTEGAMEYRNHNVKCMSFVRAARCPCSHEEARQSMNLQTAYIDLSHVYLDGSSRLPNTPYLEYSSSKVSGELPHLDPEPPICYARDDRCFKGDARMNQQQGLSMHHVVFERQHNFIARKLAELNPYWSVETVFQEARKILIARWQYVYCKEIIPLVIDDQLLRDAELHIDHLMKGTEVNPETETVILTESVHSELRAHQLFPGVIGDHDLLWLDAGKYFTDETFLKNLLEAQLKEPMRSRFPMSPKLAQEVLKKTSEPVGLSMIMMNIQRGRDTGVPSLRDQVNWAFNLSIDSFDDLAKLDILAEEDLELLKGLYSRVEDVDMWVGGHLQKPYGSGVAPYVHQKIRLIQHHGHIYGDRFFFSHGGVFSEKQRAAIAKSSSYSQILCEVMDLDVVPMEAFRYNKNVSGKPCANFPELDLKLWQV